MTSEYFKNFSTTAEDLRGLNTTEESTPNPNPPTLMPDGRKRLTEHDRHRFEEYLSKNYTRECNCDRLGCRPDLYYQSSHACHFHIKCNIVVRSRQPPVYCSGKNGSRFEALSLASSVIDYFSRPVSEMDPHQSEALERCLSTLHKGQTRAMLEAPDASDQTWSSNLSTLASYLNYIFFGAIKNTDVKWSKDIQWGNYLGATTPRMVGKEHFASIHLNPTCDVHEPIPLDRKPEEFCLIDGILSLEHPVEAQDRLEEDEYKAKARRLVRQRLGTILHELLHAFISQLACHSCPAFQTCQHGRAWQRIAMAIEEQSGKLLGVNLDLGRLTSMKYDRWTDQTGQSICDLKQWGFFDKLGLEAERDMWPRGFGVDRADWREYTDNCY